MVQSVFGQLKSNGYSDDQIIALSDDLARLVNQQRFHKPSQTGRGLGLNFGIDLSQLGL
jgi:hypothetical protein